MDFYISCIGDFSGMRLNWQLQQVNHSQTMTMMPSSKSEVGIGFIVLAGLKWLCVRICFVGWCFDVF